MLICAKCQREISVIPTPEQDKIIRDFLCIVGNSFGSEMYHYLVDGTSCWHFDKRMEIIKKMVISFHRCIVAKPGSVASEQLPGEKPMT